MNSEVTGAMVAKDWGYQQNKNDRGVMVREDQWGTGDRRLGENDRINNYQN